MKPEAIAAITVALGGLITAVCLQIRGMTGDKFQRRVDQAAALLSGYTEMVTNLRIELKDSQQSGAAALEAQRAHAARNQAATQVLFEKERENWRLDKAEMKAEIARMTERLDDLLAQVYVLQNQPKESRE